MRRSMRKTMRKSVRKLVGDDSPIPPPPVNEISSPSFQAAIKDRTSIVLPIAESSQPAPPLPTAAFSYVMAPNRSADAPRELQALEDYLLNDDGDDDDDYAALNETTSPGAGPPSANLTPTAWIGKTSKKGGIPLAGGVTLASPTTSPVAAVDKSGIGQGTPPERGAAGRVRAQEQPVGSNESSRIASVRVPSSPQPIVGGSVPAVAAATTVPTEAMPPPAPAAHTKASAPPAEAPTGADSSIPSAPPAAAAAAPHSDAAVTCPSDSVPMSVRMSSHPLAANPDAEATPPMADRPARSAAMQLWRRVLAVLALVMLALGAGEASGAFERSAMPVPSHVFASFRLRDSKSYCSLFRLGTPPHVGSVAVIGSWDGFKRRRQLAHRESPMHSVLMKGMKEWQADVSVPCGDVSHRYRFIVDGKDDYSHGGAALWRRLVRRPKTTRLPTRTCAAL